MNASARPVAVIGPDSPIGLTVVRELDEHGLRVLALGKSADSLARASRHATIFETIDGPLAEYLPKVVARHDPLAVLAISEHHLIALASLKGKLGDTKVLCPDPDKLAVVLDKRQTLEIAQGLGIEVPQSWQPLADEDRKSKAANLAYPVAIKWADPAEVSAPLEALGLPLEKVEYAASSEALIAILSRYDVLGLYPMVQEWCPGEGLGQMLNMQDGSATLENTVEITELADLKVDVVDFTSESDADGLAVYIQTLDPNGSQDQNYELFVFSPTNYRFGPSTN